jgi:TRAP-type mannitol/chloroaromatic compound transport system permease small subunit
MLRGKHIMILVIILLVSFVNLAIYFYWDIPTERDWKIGSNYTIPMALIPFAEIATILVYVGFTICKNWTYWWNSEIKININKH